MYFADCECCSNATVKLTKGVPEDPRGCATRIKNCKTKPPIRISGAKPFAANGCRRGDAHNSRASQLLPQARLLLAVGDVVRPNPLAEVEVLQLDVDLGQVVLRLVADQLARIGDVQAFEAV